MAKNYVSAVFDRRKQIKDKGVGFVEIQVYLSRTQRKFIKLKSCTESEWKRYESSKQLAAELSLYNSIVEKMVLMGEELTIYNFDIRAGIEKMTGDDKERVALMSSPTGFIEFMERELEKEKLAVGTRRRKEVTIRAVKNWGVMSRLAQVTVPNICRFDEWLHRSGTRTTVGVFNYHKVLRKYTRMAYEQGFLIEDPYECPRCHFERGRCKERNPLSEEELLKIRELEDLDPKLERARDLFIFSAYTGLAYADAQIFDFDKMTELREGTYFIDGSRIKTGNKFFTPILPPAMEILKKYDYTLPHISNQRLNDYLHLLELKAELNKPLTTHVARHSFATLVLSYDIPIENLARMLGHTNIKTTQIYGKILKTTIERHAKHLSMLIK